MAEGSWWRKSHGWGISRTGKGNGGEGGKVEVGKEEHMTVGKGTAGL